MTQKKPLIILSGPTAVGKTSLSIGLAKAVGGEIVSADSMQVYRHMDIGTAKIRPDQMQGVPHHLIDILEPEEDFNVLRFQTLAKKAMEGIYERGHIPILTGGTGFYIQSILYDIDFKKEADGSQLRKELEEIAKEQGGEYLYSLLLKEDPESAAVIHKNNVKKVIRALEFFRLSGESIAIHNKMERQKEAAYRHAYFVLHMNREGLYKRIERRIDQMMEDGLLVEVEELKKRGLHRGMVSMSGLGYKEILSYLDGEQSLSSAVSQLKRDTRHFAKRQLTWFRRERDVLWLDKEAYPSEDAILEQMLRVLKEKEVRYEQNKGNE